MPQGGTFTGANRGMDNVVSPTDGQGPSEAFHFYMDLPQSYLSSTFIQLRGLGHYDIPKKYDTSPPY